MGSQDSAQINSILYVKHDKLEEIQLASLKKTLVSCYEHVAFYKESFDAAGFDPYSVTSLNDLKRAPFTTKQDMRDAYPMKMLAVPQEEVKEIHMSSGTTGIATAGAYTDKDLKTWGECFARGIQFGGGGAGDVCQICYGYGLFTGGLGAHYGSIAAGCTTIPMSSGSTERQIRIMRDMGATILCCTPSYAMYLADTAIQMGLDPHKDFKLRFGVHGAEPFSNNFRAELEEKMGYKVLDVYGLTEIMGPGVAVECLEQSGLHIAEDHFYAEIVDPNTGEPVPDGEWGELVITTLDREASPVIRYRTRDITRIMPGECACGCTHRRIDRLHGRTDDMLVLRGVNVFPSQIEDVMKTFPDVSSYYVIELTTEKHMDAVTLKAELNPDFDFDSIKRIERLQHDIQAALKKELLIGVRVKLVEPKTIERVEDGKVKRVIDMRVGVHND